MKVKIFHQWKIGLKDYFPGKKYMNLVLAAPCAI